MWRANAHAHPKTSASPFREPAPPAPVRSKRPSAERTAAAQTGAPTGMRNSNTPKSGVSTTNNPVTKPAADALVYCKPTVWKT